MLKCTHYSNDIGTVGTCQKAGALFAEILLVIKKRSWPSFGQLY